MRTLVALCILVIVGAACSLYEPYGVSEGHDFLPNPGTAHQARARAAVEFHCPSTQVALRPKLQQQAGGDTYAVSACGAQAVYTCIYQGPCIREPLDDAGQPMR